MKSTNRVYELDFEIYSQFGRNRDISFSIPYPHTVISVNNKKRENGEKTNFDTCYIFGATLDHPAHYQRK